jgi:hypothetical protein
MIRFVGPLIVYTLIVWSFVVFLISTFSQQNPQLLVLIPFCIISTLVLWSFTMTCFVNPGTVTGILLEDSISENYCKKCQFVRPIRAHHCSSCQKCIQRMDHHCPWFGTCIGLYNYRYFLQFLFYTITYCLMISVQLYLQRNDNDLNVFLVWVASLVFGCVLMLFFLSHVYLLIKNQTTIESLDGNEEFDLGWKRNIQSIFPHFHSILPL